LKRRTYLAGVPAGGGAVMEALSKAIKELVSCVIVVRAVKKMVWSVFMTHHAMETRVLRREGK